MSKTRQKVNNSLKTTSSDFNFNSRSLTLSALFIALSVVGKSLLSVTIGPFRISAENLPIFLGAITLGPTYGAAIGALADLLGCIPAGFIGNFNPIITAGAALIGLVAGLTYKKMKSLWKSVFAAHFAGSIIVKSLGLAVFYGFPPLILLWRLPLYVIVAVIEIVTLELLLPRLGCPF